MSISEITNSILKNNLSKCSEESIIKAFEDLFDPNIDDILKSSFLTAINFTNGNDYSLLISYLTKVLKKYLQFFFLVFAFFNSF